MLGLLMFTLDFGSLFIHERHKKRMIEFLVGSYQIICNTFLVKLMLDILAFCCDNDCRLYVTFCCYVSSVTSAVRIMPY